MEYAEYILIAVAFILVLILVTYLIYSYKKEAAEVNKETEIPKTTKENHHEIGFQGRNLRKNFRVPLDHVSCFVEFMDVDNEDLNPKHFNAILRNISIGGAKFVCEYEFPILDELNIKLRFSLRESIFMVKGRIVRKELYPERDIFGYGVQFTNLFDEDRELLYQILNRVVIERRRNRVVGE
ncbi:PilZ domain-containing protein [Ornithinibacillus xuwenensis]|uniref:PilZ domain-containing protein n=1 Tax=Ornithinibacillus xuwenensis TaxID=3144668 RepID=A0ABU9XK77_9BACI